MEEPVTKLKPKAARPKRTFDKEADIGPDPTEPTEGTSVASEDTEGGEDAPEPPEDKEEGTEAGTEGTAKPKPKAKRPPMAVNKAPTVGLKAFQPDLSKLQSLNETPEFLRVVLYGDGGVGKSTSLATLAKRGRIAVVDTEASLRASALRKLGIPTDNILRWTDWSHDGLEQFYVTVKAELEADPNAFFAVGIDTGTALVHFLVEEAVRTSMATPAMQKNHPNRSPLDVFQDDYGTMTEMIKSTITRKLFQLPCHVVIICHSTRRENEDGLIRVGPAMPPAAGQALFTYSDWVLQMTREEKGKNNESVRFIRAAPKGQIEAKDRYNVLQPVEENKHLLELIEFWEESQ